MLKQTIQALEFKLAEGLLFVVRLTAVDHFSFRGVLELVFGRKRIADFQYV